MNEEELVVQESVSTQTETLTSVEQKTETLNSLPRIEELRRSEQEVKINTEVQGATQVEQQTRVKDKIFTRKVDEKKVHLKKRLKIVTAVYTTVVALLLGFVVTNIVTLAMLDKSITTNTKTINSVQKQIDDVEIPDVSAGDKPIEITINEPRDYSEDEKELTWLDKITILFRNLFG